MVFKWLMKGFSGFLLPEQLLNLWDMILAYDSLEVLPLLAVTILSFRKDNLLQVNTLPNVEVSIIWIVLNKIVLLYTSYIIRKQIDQFFFF